MSRSALIRSKLLGAEGSTVSSRSHAKRWSELLARYPDFSTMKVIDLGGTVGHWRAAPVRPPEVLVVNLDPNCLRDPEDGMTTLQGDACHLPDEVYAQSFDLVYSNSLIEHVGGYHQRIAFAESVRRLSPHHWIQTPARSFPIEPHAIFPGFQFLPVSAQARVGRSWPLTAPGFKTKTHGEAVDFVLGIELVSTAEMLRLFPGSALYKERFAGLTKSIVAIA
jgi:hypothetical protein